jgi:hypothetical protein
VVAMAAAFDCGQWLVGGNNDGGDIGREEEGGCVVGVWRRKESIEEGGGEGRKCDLERNNRVNVLVGCGERE